MPRFRIADIVVDMEQNYLQTAAWYQEYLTDEPLDFQRTLRCNPEHIEYLVTEGVDIDEAIAENILLCDLFNRLLIRFDGSFIHSSAVMYNHRVYLLSADSGVGKSTLAARWCRLYPDNTRIINDDKPSFRIIDGKCIVYGTPFAGGTSVQTNKKGELGAIVFLERANEDKLERLTTAQAMPLLFQQTPRKLSAPETNRLLELYGAVLENYPIYKLYCTDSDNAVDTVLDITK